ncbi:MAG: hypothetical protein PHE55_04515 [Methylococcaceae bacterium]|nr:hypothetical protein [Methylococcaceae bacterium]
MPNPDYAYIPSRSLSREITAALLIKLVLLAGLWYLFFHEPHGASRPPGIESLFGSSPRAPVSTNPKEIPHDIR